MPQKTSRRPRGRERRGELGEGGREDCAAGPRGQGPWDRGQGGGRRTNAQGAWSQESGRQERSGVTRRTESRVPKREGQDTEEKRMRGHHGARGHRGVRGQGLPENERSGVTKQRGTGRHREEREGKAGKVVVEGGVRVHGRGSPGVGAGQGSRRWSRCSPKSTLAAEGGVGTGRSGEQGSRRARPRPAAPRTPSPGRRGPRGAPDPQAESGQAGDAVEWGRGSQPEPHLEPGSGRARSP